MKHVKQVTQPRKVMSMIDIFMLVGSILSGVGTILITVAQSVGGSKSVG